MAAVHALIARVPLINDTHRGPVVNLAAWISMTTMCLAVVTVLISKLVVLRKLMWNDMILISAMIASIGFVISINVQVSHGLGAPLDSLSKAEYNSFQAAGYASQMLYIVGLFLGKISTLSLLVALSPNKTYRLPMWIVGGVTLLWAVVALFATAFQCDLPRPWLYTTGQCFGQTAFWQAIGVVDILTDLAIMGLPLYLVHNLQLAFQKKVAVCFAFSFRSLAIACAIFRLAEVSKFFHRGTNITFESWIPTIATILELFFGVFAACVPHLRPFMESIQAGYLSGVIHDSDGDARFGYGNDSYLMGKTNHTKNGSMIHSQALRSRRDRAESFDLTRQGTKSESRIGHALTSEDSVTQVDGMHDSKDLGRARSDSINSNGARSDGSVGSKAMIIKTTKEWTVSYQDA